MTLLDRSARSARYAVVLHHSHNRGSNIARTEEPFPALQPSRIVRKQFHLSPLAPLSSPRALPPVQSTTTIDRMQLGIATNPRCDIDQSARPTAHLRPRLPAPHCLSTALAQGSHPRPRRAGREPRTSDRCITHIASILSLPPDHAVTRRLNKDRPNQTRAEQEINVQNAAAATTPGQTLVVASGVVRLGRLEREMLCAHSSSLCTV